MATLKPRFHHREYPNKVERDMVYNKKYTTQICFRLNKKTDKDIILWLDAHKPIMTTLKALIRKAMEEEQAP